MSDLQREIETLFKQYEDIWNSQDLGRLKELWDAEDPNPFYLAEEQDDWRVGWEAVERYWVPTPGKSNLDSIMMGYRDFHVKQIAPDLAICACWVRHDMKMKGPYKPTGGDARVMGVFRHKREGWRFIAYMEGPLSPALYVMKLYEMNVSPGFEAFNQRAVAAQQEHE
jgi:hypothetical protein